MLNKIDAKLLGKISVLELKDECVEVVVLANDYNRLKILSDKYTRCQEILELPMIKAIAMKVSIKDLYQLASENSIRYISSSSKVCGLVYESKKVMNVSMLQSWAVDDERHTCVIIDTGIYPHIDFCLGRNRLIKFVDLIDSCLSPYDDNGHGTFVAGVLCGNSIIGKYTGIDNKCNIIVIKALDGDGETSSIKILQAMQWVLDNKEKYNIKVVCMSFGSELSETSDPLVFGAEVLWNNGVVVVSAGGNSGPTKGTIMSPGGSRKVITVGALDSSGKDIVIADFSSRGPALGHYKPDMLAPGVDIISADVFSESGHFYTKMSGTSVSTPMVAGICSLLLCINPRYTPDEIKYMLINSCVPISKDRNAEGYGRLDLSRIKLI